MAAGFDGYLAKPIDPEAFVSQIERFLGTAARGTIPIGSALASTSESRGPRPGAHTVLVVDDVNANLEFAVSLLEHSGYRAMQAQNMEEALALARRSTPDLILSDVWMTVGSGFQLIEQLKSDPGLRNIPVVLITSTLSDYRNRAKGLALGAMRYLTRPIDPQKLLAEIEACLPGKD
jgi:two-component system, cell cycle response regulator